MQIGFGIVHHLEIPRRRDPHRPAALDPVRRKRQSEIKSAVVVDLLRLLHIKSYGGSAKISGYLGRRTDVVPQIPGRTYIEHQIEPVPQVISARHPGPFAHRGIRPTVEVEIRNPRQPGFGIDSEMPADRLEQLQVGSPTVHTEISEGSLRQHVRGQAEALGQRQVARPHPAFLLVKLVQDRNDQLRRQLGASPKVDLQRRIQIDLHLVHHVEPRIAEPELGIQDQIDPPGRTPQEPFRSRTTCQRTFPCLSRIPRIEIQPPPHRIGIASGLEHELRNAVLRPYDGHRPACRISGRPDPSRHRIDGVPHGPERDRFEKNIAPGLALQLPDILESRRE